MNSEHNAWEASLQETAASFPYPPTPDVIASVRQRLAGPPPRWTRRQMAYAVTLLLLAVSLLAAPPVRAALVTLLRAGAISIFVGEPTPTAVPPTQVPQTSPRNPSDLPLLATTVDPQAGRVTLAEAQSQARFALRLPPAYGLPDEVYVQPVPDLSLDGQVVIMVWRDPAQPEQARLSLYQINAVDYGLKHASRQVVQQVEVNGEMAFWVEGGHEIQFPNGSYLVEQDVLLWVEDGVTYRLESGLSLDETVRIAESLRRLVPNP